MALLGTCKCGRSWSGTVECHCRVCHEHFSTVQNFDRHGPDRRGCPHPSAQTRKKKDGTVVPMLKPVEGKYGITWVSFTDDGRYPAEAAS